MVNCSPVLARRVTTLFAGPRMIEVQLLRYPYCSVSGAYTLHPVWGKLPGADRFPHVALDEDISVSHGLSTLHAWY